MSKKRKVVNTEEAKQVIVEQKGLNEVIEKKPKISKKVKWIAGIVGTGLVLVAGAIVTSICKNKNNNTNTENDISEENDDYTYESDVQETSNEESITSGSETLEI